MMRGLIPRSDRPATQSPQVSVHRSGVDPWGGRRAWARRAADRGPKVSSMPVFVLRLKAPRPRFAQPLTPAEQEIMARHGAHWRPYLECGEMVAFGPVLTDEDSYGLAIVETDDEGALRDFAAEDPVVTTGTASFEIGRMADDGTSARGGRDRRPARRGRTRVDARSRTFCAAAASRSPRPLFARGGLGSADRTQAEPPDRNVNLSERHADRTPNLIGSDAERGTLTAGDY